MRLFAVTRDESEGTIVCRVRRVADGYEVRLVGDGQTQCRFRCGDLAGALNLASRWLTGLQRDDWRSSPVR